MNDYKNNGDTTEVFACRRLVCAIIEQAVMDYRMLERKGVLRAGRLIPGAFKAHLNSFVGKKMGRGFAIESEARQVLMFFNKDLEYWLDLAQLPTCARAVKAKLGFYGGFNER